MSASKSASDDPGHCKTRMYRTRTYQSYGVAEGHSPPASGCRSLPLLGSGCPVGSSLGISRGLSLARGACHSSAVYDADPLRSLPKPQQRRVHLAVILGRVGGRSSSFSASTRGVPGGYITIHAAEVGGSCRHGLEFQQQTRLSVG